MSFKQFNGVRPKTTITVSSTAIHITNEVFELLGKPEKVNLLFDKVKKSIWLYPDENGTNKFGKSKGNYYYISTKISSEIPKGWYKYQQPKQDTNGAIFEYDKPSPKRTTKKEAELWHII